MEQRWLWLLLIWAALVVMLGIQCGPGAPPATPTPSKRRLALVLPTNTPMPTPTPQLTWTPALSPTASPTLATPSATPPLGSLTSPAAQQKAGGARMSTAITSY